MSHYSTVSYKTLGTKRNVLKQGQTCNEPHIVRTLQLDIPVFLSESFWFKYNYSLDDIYRTLKGFKSYFLWHLALFEFLTITNSACKCSTDKLNSIDIGAKQVAIGKLKRYYSNKFKKLAGLPSVLETKSLHVPPLPKRITTNVTEFLKLQDSLVQTSYQVYNPFLPYIIDNQMFVPRENEVDKIWMNRIELKSDYFNNRQEPQSLTMASAEIMLNGKIYVYAEESFHLQLNS